MSIEKAKELLNKRIAISKVSADNEHYLIELSIKEAEEICQALATPAKPDFVPAFIKTVEPVCETCGDSGEVDDTIHSVDAGVDISKRCPDCPPKPEYTKCEKCGYYSAEITDGKSCPACQSKPEPSGEFVKELRKHLLLEKARIERCIKRDEKKHIEFKEKLGEEYSGHVQIGIDWFKEDLAWVEKYLKAADYIDRLETENSYPGKLGAQQFEAQRVEIEQLKQSHKTCEECEIKLNAELVERVEQFEANYQKICDEKRNVEIGLAAVSVLNEKLKTELEAEKNTHKATLREWQNRGKRIEGLIKELEQKGE